ncbi:hypothetical protein NGC81_06590 [Staphylococcus xylosus]|uniref:hypothetical protein n=1 Tax=Staphylococcus xylosus TaxID=1288 RepID=UPI002DBDAF16|nr:hypothetical protein [Staphylococcus xylosus]MEB7756278.1 hypothetical protein [Staphylococcus xylosus]
MNVEEITLKRLKSENEYLEQIYFKHLKKICENDEERSSIFDKHFAEATESAAKKFTDEEVENSDGIIKEIRVVSSDIK